MLQSPRTTFERRAPQLLARWAERNGAERERPRTAQSFCVPKSDIAAQGYVEEEYLVPGAANVYEYDDAWQLQVRNADLPFVTRLLVRRRVLAGASGLQQ